MNNNNSGSCFPPDLLLLHKTPVIIKAIHEQERAREQKKGTAHYNEKIKNWEYAYCVDCKQIRFSSELEATPGGIRCSKCTGYNLEAPGWVVCPHHKDSLVKCPRAGKRIVKSEHGTECQDHCNFRLPAG
ncbi:MAG: hypothetical protein ACQESO_06480 [Bacillota bacterium]